MFTPRQKESENTKIIRLLDPSPILYIEQNYPSLFQVHIQYRLINFISTCFLRSPTLHIHSHIDIHIFLKIKFAVSLPILSLS